ncbi:glucan biosynthesis protein [Roseomonas sp. CECT 9278]|uniref:glucan biosynthesis protein n=1 Tax=Roseomonas sp. CECT 9278 TaxID=2845823 RepID=UPI001E5697D9|nr:glucan biosynthesis protein G [Roseomonas sp. CECT 9278]CAH0198703.1 Glucans biosynthesis protein G [Roseomonas sp. CECT 9278]
MDRRDFILGMIGSGAAMAMPAGSPTTGSGARQAMAPSDVSVAFGETTVAEIAAALAAQPHRPARAALPQPLADLDYDGYRRIRFDATQALWADTDLPFRLLPHHRGFLFRDRVDLFEVAEGRATALRYDPAQFDFDGMAAPDAAAELGFAGFRVTGALNRPDHFDEICTFLGASYFRALGRGQVYGISARGLAVRTADPAGEEFPAFTAFWIERPAAGATSFTIHALLESASLTGAWRLVVQPGETTVMDVTAQLFARRAVPRIGIAPGTSMYFFGPGDRAGISDYRPGVHDSDGLLMVTGRGEQIWRPLRNPRELQVSGFQDSTPRGFGLLQRSRDFAAFQDLEAAYHRRPHLWVEPLEDWGPGEIQLVEIPSRDEIHDNIVAAWCPRGGVRPGTPATLRYRLHWSSREPADGRLLRFAATRTGTAQDPRGRLFVLDTSPTGGAAAPLPEIAIEASAGTTRHAVVQPNPETGGLRATFELVPGTARVAELRVRLMRLGVPVSESWAYRWTA